MADNRLRPVIHLYHNPYEPAISNDQLLHLLSATATAVKEEIISWVAEDEVSTDRVYSLVILDPTKPRDQTSIDQRIMAIILFGKAEKHVAESMAMADVHDRHGRPSTELINEALFCLGSSDLARCGSASYQGVIAAGSGLNDGQNRRLAHLALTLTMEAIRTTLSAWRSQQRESEGSLWLGKGQPGWYNMVRNCLRPVATLDESSSD